MEDDALWRSGTVKMAVGQVQIVSQITLDRATFNYGVLHLGDHNVIAGVRGYRGPELYQNMRQQLAQAFQAAEFPEVIRLLDQFFQGQTNSLRHLFRDEQERVMDQLVENALQEALTYNRHIYEHSASLMRFLKDMGQPIPPILRDAAGISIREQVHQQLITDPVDFAEIRRLLSEAREWDLLRDWSDLPYEYELFIKKLSRELAQDPTDLVRLQFLIEAVQIAKQESLHINLEEAQLVVFRLTVQWSPEHRGTQRQWEQYINQLDELLAIRRG